MEAMMGSSSLSSWFKLVSHMGKNRGFVFGRDDLMGKAEIRVLRSPLCSNLHNNNRKDVNLKLSLSPIRILHPVSVSSSLTQAEVNNHKLELEELANATTSETKTVHVKFQLQRQCIFGQQFVMVGDDPMFGMWDPKDAVPLTWSDGHIWTAELDIPIGKSLEYKFIMQGKNGELMWQPGPNRVLDAWETDKTIILCEDWDNAEARTIIEAESTLNQTEESTVTPGTEVVVDNLGVPVGPGESSITDGTPCILKKSSTTDAENIFNLEVNTNNTHKEEPIVPQGHAKNLEKLVSYEGVPVLVPGLSPLPTTDVNREGQLVNEAPAMSSQAKPASKKDELELVNGATVMSAGANMAKDLKLPEQLDSKKEEHVNNSNLTQPTKILSTDDEKQESCVSRSQEKPKLAEVIKEEEEEEEKVIKEEEDDHQNTQALESPLNVIQWGKKALQKLLNSLGFR